MPRKKLPPKVKLPADFAEGRNVALARAAVLFAQANGDGKRAVFEKVRAELPGLNGGDHTEPYREGYESGRELALCRIIERGGGDPRIPLADEVPEDEIEVIEAKKARTNERERTIGR